MMKYKNLNIDEFINKIIVDYIARNPETSDDMDLSVFAEMYEIDETNINQLDTEALEEFIAVLFEDYINKRSGLYNLDNVTDAEKNNVIEEAFDEFQKLVLLGNNLIVSTRRINGQSDNPIDVEISINVDGDKIVNVLNTIYANASKKNVDIYAMMKIGEDYKVDGRNNLSVFTTINNLENTIEYLRSINIDKVAKKPSYFTANYEDWLGIDTLNTNTNDLASENIILSVFSGIDAAIKNWVRNNPTESLDRNGQSLLRLYEIKEKSQARKEILEHIIKYDSSIYDLIREEIKKEMISRGIDLENPFIIADKKEEEEIVITIPEPTIILNDESLETEFEQRETLAPSAYDMVESGTLSALEVANQVIERMEYAHSINKAIDASILVKYNPNIATFNMQIKKIDGTSMTLKDYMIEQDVVNRLPFDNEIMDIERNVLTGAEFFNKYIVNYLTNGYMTLDEIVARTALDATLQNSIINKTGKTK